MDRGRITSGGEKKDPFCHCCQQGSINSKNPIKIMGSYYVSINAKGGDCWIWFYVVIDFKKG